ncbi:MAG: transcriptional regulator [Cyanobacteria bacterium P01_D01_bin.36]
MKTSKSYHSYLVESLKDKEEAAAYLDAVFEDGSPEEVALALKNVAEARRQLIGDSQKSNADWEKCYHLLEQSQMPALPTLLLLFSELGLKLSITVKQEQPV